jgi:Kef-type K+ transport system membrane component KefB
VLLQLAVILLAAKLAAELCERINVPAVVGEILIGIVIGPSLLGWVAGDSEIIIALAEVGVLLLMVQVGMEMDLAELGKVGRASMLVAVVGVVVPFALGIMVGLGFGESGNTALFVGAALTATSVGITARVFGDLRALATTEARIVLGAAVADDVLGLIILTVVVKIVTGGSVGVGTVFSTVGTAVGFLVVAVAVAALVIPWLFARIGTAARSSATIVVLAFALMLFISWTATKASLAPIIGAFVAGIAIGRSNQHARVERDFAPIANVFIPIFFVQIGLNADIQAMARPAVLGLASALVIVAIIGKLVSSGGAYGVSADKVLIGIGMIPRGEVGIIFASIGLTEGVLGDDQYASLLIVILVTTLITPPLLRWRIKQSEAGPDTSSHEPEGPWELAVVGDHIVLRGDPAPERTVSLALDVARRATTATPDPSIVDWFGRHRNAPVSWSTDDTASLLVVMREGDARSWRFLDVTGVLDRALPEVGAALAHRRADVGELDPTRVLQLPTVERLSGHSDDTALLAALVSDVCETGQPECVARLAQRLDPSAADRIVAVVEGAALLQAFAGDPNALAPRRVMQLGEKVRSLEVLDDAYLLAATRLDEHDWRHGELDELHRGVASVLSHPELSDSALTPGEARRSAALSALAPNDEMARSRVAAAPTTFLLSNDTEEVARQAHLVEPLPQKGVVRVAVGPEAEPDHWRIDVSCRDRRGLLARLTRVLAEADLDVVSASLATWPDGGVVDSFVVRSAQRPSARDLSGRMERGMLGRMSPSTTDIHRITFDDDALPWHTVCVVRGTNRPGALAAIAAAFDVAKVDVHAAHVSESEVSETIENRFEVSDRHGGKLDARRRAAVRSALRCPE